MQALVAEKIKKPQNLADLHTSSTDHLIETKTGPIDIPISETWFSTADKAP